MSYVTPVEKRPPHYHAEAVPTGWCVYEETNPIAYCVVETYARAIARSLNLGRAYAVTGGRLLHLPPPEQHCLN